MKCISFNGRLIAIVLFSLLFVFGCGSTRYIMKYGATDANAKVWPDAPEVPRYRFVGELTGEDNFSIAEEDQGFGSLMTRFLSALAGLGSDKADKRILLRPQTGMVDALGRIYVTDAGRQAVFVFDNNQKGLDIWQFASSTKRFASPVGIAMGKDNTIFVADADRGIIVQLDYVGEPINNFGGEVLERPTGLAIDPASGHIYVADTKAHNIKVFNQRGEHLETFGGLGDASGEFNRPTHLAFRAGNLYITDTFNTRIQILKPDGAYQQAFGRRGLFLGDLVRPKGVAVDQQGNIYVVESYHDFLLVYNAEGQFLLPIGGTGHGVGEFYLPAGVWTDAHDQIYIADMFNGRVVVLQYLGTQQKPPAAAALAVTR